MVNRPASGKAGATTSLLRPLARKAAATSTRIWPRRVESIVLNRRRAFERADTASAVAFVACEMEEARLLVSIARTAPCSRAVDFSLDQRRMAFREKGRRAVGSAGQVVGDDPDEERCVLLHVVMIAERSESNIHMI